VVLEAVAAVAVDFPFQFLRPADGLFVLFVFVDLLLQTQQYFNILEVVQFLGLIVEYLHVQFTLDGVDYL
jgi:hypothetical protein